MPVWVDKLENLLTESKYNKEKSQFLIDGFRHGFSLGYAGKTNVKIRSPNLKFRGVGNKTNLWNKVMKEVKLKRYAGPFDTIPFENYIQSPIGLVPKDNGKDARLIFHLSYPRGSGLSVNENTPTKLSSVKYPDFNDAIQLCLRCLEIGDSCNLSKSDMRSPFRNLRIKPEFWKF